MEPFQSENGTVNLRKAEHSLLATPKHFAAYGGVSGGILASVEEFNEAKDLFFLHGFLRNITYTSPPPPQKQKLRNVFWKIKMVGSDVFARIFLLKKLSPFFNVTIPSCFR